MTRRTWCPASPPWLFTHEAQACMVSDVWLIDEASGPVQLHRSAIVTVLPELAAPADEAGVTTSLTGPATPNVPISSPPPVLYTRTISINPMCLPAPPPSPHT